MRSTMQLGKVACRRHNTGVATIGADQVERGTDARRRCLAVAAFAVMLAMVVGTPTTPALGAAGDEAPAVANELLIGYWPGATPDQRMSTRRGANAELVERVARERDGRGEVELVRLPQGTDRSAAKRRIEAEPGVAYAEPNWIYTHAAISEDPYYKDGSLWGLYGDGTTPANPFGSHAGEVWATNTGSKDVYIGVIDEGIQFDHPDLNGQVWTNQFDPVDGVDNDGNGYVDDVHGWDFDGGDNTIYDGGAKGSLDDHGTHVAGTIAAKADGQGVVGMNREVTLISGKFLGRRGGTTANAVKAVDYFTDLKTRHGVRIVATNNSWGGGGYSQALFDAIASANTAGILFIAAAGNGGSDGVGDNDDDVASYPSNYNSPNMVAVAAIDDTGGLASFSNFGATTVDLGAPGVGVASTTAYNSYSSYSGTSMATPHVTGAAALYAAANPTAGSAAIRNAILSSVAPTTSLASKTVTGGRLDVSSFGSVGSTTTEPTAPSAPTNLSATGGAGKVDLAWSAPVSDGGSSITGYRVYRDGANIATTDAAQLSFSDAEVVDATTYTYQVTAVNGVGEGAASNTATAAPGEASALSVTVTAGAKSRNLTDVTVTWAGFTSAFVEVTRSSSTMSTENDGTLTETWRGSGTVTYTVCETGSTTACATGSTTI